MAAGLLPDPLGELTSYRAIQTPSLNKKSLLLREGDGKGVEGGEKRGGEGREGLEWEGGKVWVEGPLDPRYTPACTSVEPPALSPTPSNSLSDTPLSACQASPVATDHRALVDNSNTATLMCCTSQSVKIKTSDDCL